jgi:hypothetical protein
MFESACAAFPDADIEAMMVAYLEDAGKWAPVVPNSFELAMQICINRVLPKTARWFLTEIMEISEDVPAPPNKPARWNNQLKYLIVKAAAKQVPGTVALAVSPWLKLLKNPHYADLALVSLAPNPADMFSYLRTWRDAHLTHLPVVGSQLDRDIARQKLNQIVEAGVRACHEEALRNRLQVIGAEWPMELRMEVNSSFVELGLEPVFRPRHTAEECQTVSQT